MHFSFGSSNPGELCEYGAEARSFHPQASPVGKQQRNEMQKGVTPTSSAPAAPASVPPKTSPRGPAQPPAQEDEKPERDQHERPEKPKLDRAARRAIQVRHARRL